MQKFRIATVPSSPSVRTLVLSGEADLAVAADIIEIGVMSCDEPTMKCLVVDLGAVTFIDSTALGALVHLHNFADAAGKKFRLANVPARVQRVLTISGLDQLLTVVEGESPAQSDPSTTPASLRGRQCAAVTASRNRCQLQALHDGPHAAATQIAYLTWTADRDPYHWSLTKPPEWLLTVDWIPEAQPKVETSRLDEPQTARTD
jgi:anti-sigma B factor antagonist